MNSQPELLMEFEEYYRRVSALLAEHGFCHIDREMVWADWTSGLSIEESVELFLDEDED